MTSKSAKRGLALLASASVLVLAVDPAAAQPAPAGRMGMTLADSVPFPDSRPPARAGAPNVLVWIIDDVGFGQIGAFGGLIETPNIDALAKRGLEYANFHATPICSASRAALLTGRNSHAVHVGSHSGAAAPFPGYDSRVPADAGTLAENLRAAGYVTYALGKWDHLPNEDVTAAGPFTYWPSGQGFDRFYGFLSAEADNFHPTLWSDHTPVEAPRDPDYHLSADLADHAIDWIGDRGAANPRRPFFLYWATGTAHAPHHAPKAWLDHYRGRFDMGWDAAREQILKRQIQLGIVPPGTKLAPRPQDMPAWNSLSPEQKRVYARQMEAFAAAVSYTDAQFGRIIETLRASGELDNTIIAFLPDNGASAEGAHDGSYNEGMMPNGRYPSAAENAKYYDAWGTAESYPTYSFGWAVAGNTPFRYYKQTTYEGGARVPLIVSWPKGIAARGQVRNQFLHISDVTPTILEAAGVEPAKTVHDLPQRPFDGASFAATFADPKAAAPKTVQYFEMFGNRAIWAGGWKAVTPHRLATWDMYQDTPFSQDKWQLFDLRRDMTETTDVASAHPEKLRELQALFDREAKRNNVYPLLNIGDSNKLRGQKVMADFRARGGIWEYSGRVERIPEALAPPILWRSYTAKAKLRLDKPDADGVIFAMGGKFGGLSFYLSKGRPSFSFINPDLRRVRIQADRAAPEGEVELGLEFARDDAAGSGAKVRLFVGGQPVAEGQVPGPIPRMFSINETMGVGLDSGTSASPDYVVSPAFDGAIEDLRFDANTPATPGR